MYESDVWLMPNWKRRLLGVRYERFNSHINTLCIKLDRTPNPTKEERVVSKLPVKAYRYIATHWPGKLILRGLFRNNDSGPASLINSGSCLEIFPIPKGALEPHKEESDGEKPE